MSMNSVNSRDVGQALVASKSTRRNRHPNNAKSSNVASSNTARDKNCRGSTNEDKRHNGMRNNCHRCLEPQSRWCECTAHVVPAPKESQDGSGSINGSLLISVESSMSNAVGERNSSDDSIEK